MVVDGEVNRLDFELVIDEGIKFERESLANKNEFELPSSLDSRGDDLNFNVADLFL